MGTQNGGSFARLGDVAPEGMKKENSGTDRLLLPYIRCQDCKKQFAIQTCGIDKEHRCSERDKEHGEGNMHTHILCGCDGGGREIVFSGIVSFRTTKDTDSYNERKKLSWEDKKKLFKASV